MPIRINLKELFDSDSQEITIDKVNFNFNKLLELGIGLPGPIGITGNIGAAGPIGPQGLIGPDGNKWYVGADDPNGQSFTDLNDDDFFIDVDDSSIWQYDAVTDSWILLVDFGQLVNNFLASSGATFVRGIGDSSPLDDRYIVFPFRGNTASDSLTDLLRSNTTNNDIFYLNNFNESIYTISNWPAPPDGEEQLYTAIQKIDVDYTGNIYGRYHLELGTLRKDLSNSNKIITELKHNLKIRHTISDLTDGGTRYLANSLQPINIGRFSMSKPETDSPTEIDYNSFYEFISTKINDPSEPSGEVTVRMGSREALGEPASSKYIQSDGIEFENHQYQSASIGIAAKWNFDDDIDDSVPSRYGDDVTFKDYLMLDHDSSLEGIFINKTLIQNHGNIEQIGSSLIRFKKQADFDGTTTIINDNNSFGQSAITVIGNQVFGAHSTILKADGSGYPQKIDNNDDIPMFGKYNISQADNPEYTGEYVLGIYSLIPCTNLIPDACSINTNTINNKISFGPSLCDMVNDGNYIYTVHNILKGSSRCDFDTSQSIASAYTSRVYFQVLEIHQKSLQIAGSITDNIGQIDPLLDCFDPGNFNGQVDGSSNWDLAGAWRIALDGKYCIVATNRLKDFGHPTIDMDLSETFPLNANCIAYANTALNNLTTQGFIHLIDISDPYNPQKVGSIMEDKYHHLDMAIYGDFIFTVTADLDGARGGGGGVPDLNTNVAVLNDLMGISGNGATCSGYGPFTCTKLPGFTGATGSDITIAGHKVKIIRYLRDCDGNIKNRGEHLLINNAATINKNTYKECDVLNQFGAIDVDGNYIYAIHQSKLVIINHTEVETCALPLVSTDLLGTGVVHTLAFTSNTASLVLALDIKIVGDSLYILWGLADNNNDQYSHKTRCYITKYDVKDRANPEFVYAKLLEPEHIIGGHYSGPCKLVVVGNNIYIHTPNQALGLENTNGSGPGGLISFEIDGIETDHAKISTIKSSDILATNDIKVGNSLIVGNSANIGCSLKVPNIGASNIDVSNINVSTINVSNLTVGGSPPATALPAGTIISTIVLVNPPGWIQMHGQLLSTANSIYPDLFAVVPSSWIIGGTDIQLPQTAGQFLMGSYLGNSVGDSVSSTPLTTDNIPRHTHDIEVTTNQGGIHTHEYEYTTPAGNEHQTGAGGSQINFSFRVDTDIINNTSNQQETNHSHQIEDRTDSGSDENADEQGQLQATPDVVPPPAHLKVRWLIKTSNL